MGIIVLIGSLLIFGNSVNPDINTEALEGYYSHFRVNQTVKIRQNEETIERFTFSGANGLGFGLATTYADWPRWKHTLDLHYFREPNYHLVINTTGFEVTASPKQSTVELAVGGDLGIGDLTVYPFRKYGTIHPAYGWGVHARFTNHFLAGNQIMTYFARPAFRSYYFELAGKDDIKNAEIRMRGAELTLGLGIKF